jgi:hypothetical protein
MPDIYNVNMLYLVAVRLKELLFVTHYNEIPFIECKFITHENIKFMIVMVKDTEFVSCHTIFTILPSFE